MRIAALDVGEKRIGVALSDPTGLIATGIETYRCAAPEADLAYLAERLAQLGVDTFIECGPGKTLCGLIRKTVKGVTVLNVQDEETLKAAVEAVKAQG